MSSGVKHTSSDLVAVSVQLAEDHTIDRERIVSDLFSGIHWEGRNNVQWDGNSFCAVNNDRLRTRLFRLFGSQLSLEDVDSNVNQLIEQGWGWLEHKSDDTVEIKNGELSADLESLCAVVMTSLSQDIVSKVRSLLTNIHTILSGDRYFANTKQIDVNLFEKNGKEITCIHTRYQAVTKKRGVKIFFLGGTKRSIQINFNLRKIGISHDFAEDLISDVPMLLIQNGIMRRLELTEAAKMPPRNSTEPTCLSSAEIRSLTKLMLSNDLLNRHKNSPSNTNLRNSSSHRPRTESSRSTSAPPIPIMSLPTTTRQIERTHSITENQTDEMPEFL